jgi:hypothetical protein
MTKKMAQNREKMRDKSNVFDFILVLYSQPHFGWKKVWRGTGEGRRSMYRHSGLPPFNQLNTEISISVLEKATTKEVVPQQWGDVTIVGR